MQKYTGTDSRLLRIVLTAHIRGDLLEYGYLS